MTPRCAAFIIILLLSSPRLIPVLFCSRPLVPHISFALLVPAIMTSTGKENSNGLDSNLASDEPAAKKAKVASLTDFRDWATAKESPGPVYTIKCEFGDPSKPLASFLKTSKKEVLVRILRERGMDETCSKNQLCQRIERDLPCVRIQIDGRECVQRLVNAFLAYFGWDNSHLFEVKMPRKGDNTVGAELLVDAMKCSTVVDRFRRYFDDYGMDLEDWRIADHYRRRIVTDKLQNGKYTMEDLRRASFDCEAMGDYRVLNGQASDPQAGAYDDEMWERLPAQGNLSLHELSVETGDVMSVSYDLGDNHIFTLTVEEVETNTVLAEESLQGNPTRAKLVKKFGKIAEQYAR